MIRKMTVGLELCRKPDLIFKAPYRGALHMAVTDAKRNLYARYDVKLEGPFWDEKLPYPYVIVTAPDIANVTPSNVGRHLRGISGTMLKLCEDLRECLYGNRLFRFHILPNNEDRMEAPPKPHKYTVEELINRWTEFEAENHMGPGYHLCAEDAHKFLDFLWRKEE